MISITEKFKVLQKWVFNSFWTIKHIGHHSSSTGTKTCPNKRILDTIPLMRSHGATLEFDILRK